MACFIIPAAEAAVTTVITKVAEKNAEKMTPEVSLAGSKTADKNAEATATDHYKYESAPMKFVRKLRWLSNMLWGGALLLCFEHIWHGEVVPYPPFLTNAADPAARADMLHEMATAGVCMAALITAVWVGMVIVTNAMEKRAVCSGRADR